MSDRDLKTYLNDHDAGSAGGVRLAKLCASQNSGTPLGAYAARLIKNLEADRVILQEVIHRVGGTQAPLKQGMGFISGAMAHLKLRRPGGRSRLARFELAEGLVLAINGRRALWRTLEVVATKDARLADLPFDALALRAEQDLTEAESHRITSAREAFVARSREAAAPRRRLILQRS